MFALVFAGRIGKKSSDFVVVGVGDRARKLALNRARCMRFGT